MKSMKKIISFVLAMAFATTMAAPMAMAEGETTFVKPEDETMLVAYPDGNKEPTLSFDKKDCLDYISVSEDGVNEAGMTISTQTKVRYQGGCLEVKVANDKVRGTVETDENYVYDLSMGLQIKAEDFGLENFNGCTITMMVKFHPSITRDLTAEGALGILNNNEININAADMENTEGDVNSSRTVQYSALEAKGFRDGILTVLEPDGDKRGNSNVININFPLIDAYTGTALYIDNLTIKTPLKDADGNDLYIKNVDGYNASASVDNTENIIEVGNTVQADSVASESIAEEAGEGGKGTIIIIGVVAAVVVIGICVFIFIKLKNRYY